MFLYRTYDFCYERKWERHSRHLARYSSRPLAYYCLIRAVSSAAGDIEAIARHNRYVWKDMRTGTAALAHWRRRYKFLQKLQGASVRFACNCRITINANALWGVSLRFHSVSLHSRLFGIPWASRFYRIAERIDVEEPRYHINKLLDTCNAL